MKHIYQYLTLLMCFFAITATACKDDEEALVAKEFVIEGSELNKEIDFRSATITIPVKTNLRVSEWSVNSDQKWVTAFPSANDITLSILDSKLKSERSAKVSITSEVVDIHYTIHITQYGINDVQFKEDSKVTPTGGWANQMTINGASIEAMWDGDPETSYHSPWGYAYEQPTTQFPVIIDFFFANNAKKIDKISYFSTPGNGAIGQFKLAYSTEEKAKYEESDFTFLKDTQGKDAIFDFQMNGGTHFLNTDLIPVGVKAIRFHVLSGAGNNDNPDNATTGKVEGFVQIKEMGFFEKSNYREMNANILTVFTDLTCSALKADVTPEAIEALESNTLKRVAKALKDNTYDPWEKNFRIREYHPYSEVEYWANKLQTFKYSNLDNPTGIYVKKGEELMVLVGDIPDGYEVSLQSIWEIQNGDHVQTHHVGEKYALMEGVNMLKIKEQGQLFVMYNVKEEGMKNAPAPVKIHIPLGRGIVNGFFDLKEHQTDEKYAELLSKATHKYFCVRGERMMFYFHRLKMLDAAPTQILSAIHLWDDILKWEQEMCGIEKYRQEGVYNNHMFAISPEGAYMWASDYKIGFVYTYLHNILLRDQVMSKEDNAWGPAHEIGHAHQGAINWHSSTESSNNLFSNYIIYRLGQYKSRGRGLNYLAKCVYQDNQCWENMGSATHMDEDTEIHMRMNWQLWMYYELCRGNAENPQIWPQIFEEMRKPEHSVSTNDPGARQLEFAKVVCDVVKEDLTEFFETWGFFKPIDTYNHQYATSSQGWKYTVTKQQIAETKNYIKSKGYPKAAPIQYIEDRKREFFNTGDARYKEVGDVGYYETFKNGVKITKKPSFTETATSQGKSIKVTDGEQAVAFEVRKQETGDGTTPKMGEIVYFSTSFEFFVPRTISMVGCGLYAVQADGERILMEKK